MTTSSRWIAGLAVGAVLLAGCGGSAATAGLGPGAAPASVTDSASETDPASGSGRASGGGTAAGGDPAAGSDPAVAADAVVPLERVPTPQLPVSITDAAGDEVTVDSAARIVPLVGSIAEIVFSLGLGDAVVGRDVGASFEQAADLPLVTHGHDVNVEGVLSLEPTVVLAESSTGPPEALEQLRRSGVPVVVVEEAWTLDDVAPRIDAVATALGVGEAGAALIERTEQQLAAAADRAPDDAGDLRVGFLYLRGTAGVYLLGGPGSGADALIEAVGADDAGIAAGLTRPFTPLTSEALVDAAPDVILVMRGGLSSVGGVDGLVALPGVAQTPAGRDRRVITVDDGLLLNFGPRTGAVIELLAEELRAATAENPDEPENSA